MMSERVRTHRDLEVYRKAFEAAMLIFEQSKTFPKAETYALTDQIRRSSRSVAANITEAWRKRRYQPAFIAKLSDAETEAAETQTWVEFAFRCGYLDREMARDLHTRYDAIIGTLVGMINHPETWCLQKNTKEHDKPIP